MAKRTRLESMIPELFDHILNKRKISQIVTFLQNGIEYEEIPLIDRYQEIEFLNRYMTINKYSLCLLNIAIFLIHSIQIENTENRFSNWVGLNICDPFGELEDVGFIIPNICICNMSIKKEIDKLPLCSLADINLLNQLYGNMVDMIPFVYKSSITHDSYGDIKRIYLIPTNIVV